MPTARGAHVEFNYYKYTICPRVNFFAHRGTAHIFSVSVCALGLILKFEKISVAAAAICTLVRESIKFDYQ